MCLCELNSIVTCFLYIRCRGKVSLLSKQVKPAKNKDNEKKPGSSGASSSRASGKTGSNASGKPVDASKFELYFDFKAYIGAVKPHQVSASF